MKSMTIGAIAGASIIVAAVGMGYYAYVLSADLGTAQRQLAASQAQVADWKQKFVVSQKSLADMKASREDAAAQTAKGQEACSANVSELSQLRGKQDELTAKLVAARSATNQARTVSGYWRALFDYTKDKQIAAACGVTRTSQTAAASASGN